MLRRLGIRIFIGALACLTWAERASAADITMLEVSDAGGGAAVALGEWGWNSQSTLAVFVDESWMTDGDYSIDVDMLAADSGRGSLLTIPTDFQKSVTNLTSFVWTGFSTTIIPSPGATISMVSAQPNAEFGNVDVVDNGNGSFSVYWDNMGNNGTGVAINAMASMNFSFDVTGPSSQFVNYKLRQVPTPEPASSVLLLAVAAMGIARRARR